MLDLLSLQLMERTHRPLGYLKNMLILDLFLELLRQRIQSAHFLGRKELRLGVVLRRDSLHPCLKVDLPLVDGQPRWLAAFLKLLHRVLLQRIKLYLVLTLLQFREGLIERIVFFHNAQLAHFLHHIRSLLQEMTEDVRVVRSQVLAFF